MMSWLFKMMLILLLIFMMFLTLLLVGTINRIQARQQQRRLRQRQLRLQSEELADIVTCLEQTVPNRMIAKLINDVILHLQQQMLALEDKHPEHIEAAIRKTEARSEELLNRKDRASTSYQRDSDAQIAKTQLYLNEAMKLLPGLAGKGVIGEAELEAYLGELRWANLMVSVMSYVGQGEKSMAISDRFSAQAFYRKAQQLLLESLHPNPRRLKMIKELGEIINGDRVSLSQDSARAE